MNPAPTCTPISFNLNRPSRSEGCSTPGGRKLTLNVAVACLGHAQNLAEGAV